jgi:3-deoxy-alpha-D-manno-octulosonate 8-oxidase
MTTKIETMDDIKSLDNVKNCHFGEGSINNLKNIIKKRKEKNLKNNNSKNYAIFLIDEFFLNNKKFLNILEPDAEDLIKFISTKDEPTTNSINSLLAEVKSKKKNNPYLVVGIGGGITLDVAKALSNLLTNGGKAEDYQGWGLLGKPGVYKIGVPTISGTGSESTKTCVYTNNSNGLKLGMNSPFSVFNEIILDPDLTKTVPRDQYFYTGMDTFIHTTESLNGRYRNIIGDSFARESQRLCRTTFEENDIMNDKARKNLMVASYLGGCAIAASFVGVVHPFSSGLSVVLNLHHCIGNCITMRAMEEFYPKFYEEFWMIVEKQKIYIPKNVCKNLKDADYKKLINSTIKHEKPLYNALGENFKSILTDQKIIDLFNKM